MLSTLNEQSGSGNKVEAHKVVLRLLFLMAEEQDWKLTCTVKEQFIRMFGGIPDSRITEDIHHQHLRDLSRYNRNLISSRQNIQSTVINSKVLPHQLCKCLGS